MQQLAVLRSRGCCTLARPLPVQNHAHRLRAAASKGFGAPEEPQTTAQEVSSRGKANPRSASKKAQEQQQAAERAAAAPAAVAVPAKPQAPTTGPSSTQAQPRSSAAPRSTPQAVVDRMFKRMIACAGIPVATGILLLVMFYYLKVVQKVEFPMWIVYGSQNLMFGGGLLGITYGIMSTSWDPTREGSVLGWDEFRVNLPMVLNRDKQK